MNTPTIKYIFLLFLAAAALPASGATFTSVAAGNFNNPCTWSAGCASGIPGSTDDVVLNHDVNFNTAPTIKSLQVNAGITIAETFKVTGKLTINANVTFTKSFTVGGDLEIIKDNTLNLSGASMYVYVGGDMLIHKDVTFNLRNSASMRVHGNFCSDNSGNDSVTGDGTGIIVVDDCFQNGGSCAGGGNPNNVFDAVKWCVGYDTNICGTQNQSTNGCSLYGTLPVTLVDFQGEYHLSKNAMRLNWETRTELNNSHFVLDRSEDGQLFVPIGEVKGQGAGDFQGRFGYVFLDKNVNLPLYYYRLRQIDTDGKEGGQAPVIVGRKPGYENGFINKLHDDGTFTFELLDKNQSIRQLFIYNLSGAKAASMEFGVAGKTKAVDFDFGGMEAGIYVVKMLTEAGAYSQKIMVGQ